MLRTRNESGFTLMEVLVAISLLTIGLLSLTGLTIGNIRGNRFAKNMTTATVIAEQRLEDVQKAGYANTTTTLFPAAAENVSMDGVTFSRETTIAGNQPGANMKTITVRVSWDSGTQSVTLNTIIAQ